MAKQMEVTPDQLFEIIGKQQVEIALKNAELERLSAQLVAADSARLALQGSRAGRLKNGTAIHAVPDGANNVPAVADGAESPVTPS